MVFTIWFSSVVFCDQTVQQEYGLQFEVSQQNVRWRQGIRQGMPRPTYMAVFYLKNYYSPHIRDFGGFRRSLEGIVSPEQSRFMRQQPGRSRGHFITYGSSSYKGYDIGLYGAKKTFFPGFLKNCFDVRLVHSGYRCFRKAGQACQSGKDAG